MDICIDYCDKVDTEIVVTILTTCAALESLNLKEENSLPVPLSELIAHKCVCTGLKYLRISIDWGRFCHPTPSHLPAYYLQSWDSSPSQQDKERWTLLERLYYQIGSLVELEELNMVASEGFMNSNPYSSDFDDTYEESYRDPGRFSLQFSLGVHGSTGRRGYLSWLAGLKKLKVLRGSVHLGNPEVAMTLKQAELEWMLVHWPKLKVLALLPPPVRDFEEPYDEELDDLMKDVLSAV
ncbi:hypothetical protein BGX24_007388 [Mortierella sp. AD032]|nr:hypothetical protein BGX24_007388 [Mortierella sp. AD032]